MKHVIRSVAFISAVVCTATDSYGGALTDADNAYIRSIDRDPTLAYLHWKPITEDKIHEVIQDPKTAHSPKARKKAVQDYLDDLFATWLWCRAPDRQNSPNCQTGIPSR
jgi:hypothetical protein